MEMARARIADGREIAKRVRNGSCSSDHQIKQYGAVRYCPNCNCKIDNNDVALDWTDLPAGVKFDPSDMEVIEHLAEKCGVGNSKPHVYIEDFIPTLLEERGVCYTHPEKLPGAKKDGTSLHFFHKTANAYASGRRKRRIVQRDGSSNEGSVRWHKTGKTKPVIDNNGVHTGYKKIMVLYESSKKGLKPRKSKWVLHQFHLGTGEDEKEGEFVVSKVFYKQHKQGEEIGHDHKNNNSSDALAVLTSPRTPNPNPPNPPRREKSILADDNFGDSFIELEVQEPETEVEAGSKPSACALPKEDVGCSAWLAGESQAIDNTDFDIYDPFLGKEYYDSSLFGENSDQSHVVSTKVTCNPNDLGGYFYASSGIDELEDLKPPGSQDFPFSSQDSFLG